MNGHSRLLIRFVHTIILVYLIATLHVAHRWALRVPQLPAYTRVASRSLSPLLSSLSLSLSLSRSVHQLPQPLINSSMLALPGRERVVLRY